MTDQSSTPIIIHLDPDIKELIPDFLEHQFSDIQRMKDALINRNFEVVRKTAHAMRGSGGSYGFDAVTSMTTMLERAARKMNALLVHGEIVRLEDYFKRLVVLY